MVNAPGSVLEATSWVAGSTGSAPSTNTDTGEKTTEVNDQVNKTLAPELLYIMTNLTSRLDQ